MTRTALATAIASATSEAQRDAFDRWVSHVNSRLALRRAFDGLWSDR